MAAERTRGMPDWREQIDIGSERAALPRDAGLPAWTRLRGPNQWPAALPQLRATVTPMAGRLHAGCHPDTARLCAGAWAACGCARAFVRR